MSNEVNVSDLSLETELFELETLPIPEGLTDLEIAIEEFGPICEDE